MFASLSSDTGQMVIGSVKAVPQLLGGISRLQECDPRSSLSGFETEGTRERWWNKERRLTLLDWYWAWRDFTSATCLMATTLQKLLARTVHSGGDLEGQSRETFRERDTVQHDSLYGSWHRKKLDCWFNLSFCKLSHLNSFHYIMLPWRPGKKARASLMMFHMHDNRL